MRKDIEMFKKIKEFLIDWVWQLPQNLIGLGYKLIIYRDISDEFNNDDGHFNIVLKNTNGAVTLGKYVFIYKRYNDLVGITRHETGHVKQSRMLGPLYLFIIGIPSIIWAAVHSYIAPNKSYRWFYTEAWADKLAS